MNKYLLLPLFFSAQTIIAQQPSAQSKETPQSAQIAQPSTHPMPKMLSEVEGINPAWVKDYQQRAREYQLKRKQIHPRKDSPTLQQNVQPMGGVPAIAVTPAPAAEVVRDVPFASKNNTIELTVSNTTDVNASEIRVEVTEVPAWLVFSTGSLHLGPMAGKEQKTAILSFSVDKSAIVGQEQSVTLAVKTSSGEMWTKQIRIKVSPPEKFELFQNYPNPFNPTTTICYQLTTESKVTLRVYDILGREVQTLVDEQHPAGYHQEMFNASHLASGVYIYRIVYAEASGKRSSAQKRMLMVK